MSRKRFTDTEIWKKKWFRKLKPKYKSLWFYIKDNCDPVGVIDFDEDIASLYLGEDITADDLEIFGDRVIKIEEDKFIIKDFINFQYGKLSEKCRPHKNIIEKVKFYTKKYKGKQRVLDTLSDTLPDRVEEKEQDKDKEKEKEKEQDKEKKQTFQSKENVLDFSNDLFDNVIQAWNDELAGKKSFKHIRGLKPSSRNNFFEVISHAPELKKISSWKECFEAVVKIPFYNGENDRGFVCTLDWLLESGKIVDVLNGKFEGSGSVKDLSEESWESYQARKKAEREARGVVNA